MRRGRRRGMLWSAVFSNMKITLEHPMANIILWLLIMVPLFMMRRARCMLCFTRMGVGRVVHFFHDRYEWCDVI